MARQKIVPNQLDRMEYDEHGRLFWDGKPVVTDANLALTRRQNLIAGIIGIFAVLGGLGSFIQGIMSVVHH